MKRLVAAALVSLCACASAPVKSEAAASAATEVTPNRVRVFVLPARAEGQANEALVKTFEQVFCTKLFELNEREVVCPEDAALLAMTHRRAAETGEASERSLSDLEATLDTPRRVLVTLVELSGVPHVNVTVHDREGTTLGRFDAVLSADGSDIEQRSDELAKRVVTLPK